MKVVLFENVESLGLPGDIASVKPGYFRNYLSPRGMAVEATPGNLKMYERKMSKLRAESEKILAAARAVVDRLNDVKVEFEMRAGQNGRLFGSVTTADVAEKLQAMGFEEVDKRKVAMAAIKETGKFTAKVRLQGSVAATIHVIVKREGAEEEEAAAAAAIAEADARKAAREAAAAGTDGEDDDSADNAGADADADTGDDE